MARLGQQVQRVQQELLGQREPMEVTDQMEMMEQLEQQEVMDQMEPMDQMGHKESKVRQVRQGHKEPKVRLDRQEQLGQRGLHLTTRELWTAWTPLRSCVLTPLTISMQCCTSVPT